MTKRGVSGAGSGRFDDAHGEVANAVAASFGLIPLPSLRFHRVMSGDRQRSGAAPGNRAGRRASAVQSSRVRRLGFVLDRELPDVRAPIVRGRCGDVRRLGGTRRQKRGGHGRCGVSHRVRMNPVRRRLHRRRTVQLHARVYAIDVGNSQSGVRRGKSDCRGSFHVLMCEVAAQPGAFPISVGGFRERTKKRSTGRQHPVWISSSKISSIVSDGKRKDVAYGVNFSHASSTLVTVQSQNTSKRATEICE